MFTWPFSATMLQLRPWLWLHGCVGGEMRTVLARIVVCLSVLLVAIQLLPNPAGVNYVAAENSRAVAAATSSYAQAILADTPQAYWRLDESSGTSFADITGNGHTGTLTSAVTLGTPGALISDPTDTSVLLGSSTRNHITVT